MVSHNSYAQTQEDLFALKFFGDVENLHILSIGENNGVDLSNVKLLIDRGAWAALIEPSSVFEDLQELHKNNPKVSCFQLGIGDKNETVKFFESENHVPGGEDRALVSSVSYEDTQRWRAAGVKFHETEIKLMQFSSFHDMIGNRKFDMISIDCEGYDEKILKQINLEKIGCKLLIIEWNGDKKLLRSFTNYCAQFGLKEAKRNAENLVLTKTP